MKRQIKKVLKELQEGIILSEEDSLTYFEVEANLKDNSNEKIVLLYNKLKRILQIEFGFFVLKKVIDGKLYFLFYNDIKIEESGKEQKVDHVELSKLKRKIDSFTQNGTFLIQRDKNMLHIYEDLFKDKFERESLKGHVLKRPLPHNKIEQKKKEANKKEKTLT